MSVSDACVGWGREDISVKGQLGLMVGGGLGLYIHQKFRGSTVLRLKEIRAVGGPGQREHKQKRQHNCHTDWRYHRGWNVKILKTKQTLFSVIWVKKHNTDPSYLAGEFQRKKSLSFAAEGNFFALAQTTTNELQTQFATVFTLLILPTLIQHFCRSTRLDK